MGEATASAVKRAEESVKTAEPLSLCNQLEDTLVMPELAPVAAKQFVARASDALPGELVQGERQLLHPVPLNTASGVARHSPESATEKGGDHASLSLYGLPAEGT